MWSARDAITSLEPTDRDCHGLCAYFSSYGVTPRGGSGEIEDLGPLAHRGRRETVACCIPLLDKSIKASKRCATYHDGDGGSSNFPRRTAIRRRSDMSLSSMSTRSQDMRKRSCLHSSGSSRYLSMKPSTESGGQDALKRVMRHASRSPHLIVGV